MNTDAYQTDVPDLSFSELDRKFADFVSSLGGFEMANELWLAAALASRQTRAGHICFDLADFSGRSYQRADGPGSTRTAPDAGDWSRKLKSSSVVGEPGSFTPLIMDGRRLYLNRYWNYESELVEIIKKRLGVETEYAELPGLRDSLSRLFPPDPGSPQPDWQKVGSAVAALKNFCIISGSPGTGKTSIIVKIIVLLLERHRGEKIRVALTAPTGKAANRLKESLKKWKAGMDVCGEILMSLPDEVFTLHRLLGGRPLSATFRYNRDNPLPYDVVILDEASMVDLPLMVKLLRALPENAKFIALGDKNQLASVEAGAVFRDLCGTRHESRFSRSFARLLARVTGTIIPEVDAGGSGEGRGYLLDDAIVILRKNFRFGEKSGIHQISQLINLGKGKEAFELLAGATFPDCVFRHLPDERRIGRWLVQHHRSYYERFFSSGTPEEALKILREHMILCTLRQGPFGVENLNRDIEKELLREGFPVHAVGGPCIRPVMITANDYGLGLFNGDVGILYRDHFRQRLDAFFPGEEGRLRRVSPARLPFHVSLFAMTVHKSQGSEFDRVHFILPRKASDLLTRELVYTAVTRARKMVEISAEKETFIEVVSRKVRRTSGLAVALRSR